MPTADDDDLPIAYLYLGDESWHGGPGWYWVDVLYPEETGAVGPFDSPSAAAASVDGAYLLVPMPRSCADPAIPGSGTIPLVPSTEMTRIEIGVRMTSLLLVFSGASAVAFTLGALGTVPAVVCVLIQALAVYVPILLWAILDVRGRGR